MFWQKSKDKQSPSKSKTSSTTIFRTDGGVTSSGGAITSYESKMKSSSKGSSSKTTITYSTKQTESQKQSFSEVTRTYTQIGSGSVLSSIDSPKWTLSSSSLNEPQRTILSRQKTEPSMNIVKGIDATPFNSSYESPYRKAYQPTLRTPILPKSTITTTTTYQSPYRNTNATSSLREQKTAVLSPTRYVTSTSAALQPAVPKTTKSTTIWNPMSSVENTRTAFTPSWNNISSLPTKPSNPSTKSLTTSQVKLPTVKPPPVPAIATTPVIKSVSKKKQSPGIVYIFHNDKFDSPDKEFRSGSAEDVRVLKKTFQSFKMQVNLYENLTVQGVNSAVRKIETKDFGSASCIVVVILTHGTRYATVAARDGSYSIDDHVLFPILRNRSLRGKPKLLFIQACKGAMETTGFHKDAIQPNGPPDEILKCYSTFEGYVAYRTDKGSLFIQALCELLQTYGKSTNIKEIMDMVIRRVKERSESKQIPSYETTLTESFIFGEYT